MGEKGEAQQLESEKSFQLRLNRLPDDVIDRYRRLLTDYQVKKAEKNNGKPVGKISVAEKEELLTSARAARTYEEAVKFVQMKESFNSATTKEGRPPIGGAPDD